MKLLRVLGLWFGLAVTVGNTIGAGILGTPGQIAGLLPRPSWFIGIWIVGAMYAMLGANALSELGTMMPSSGGQFVFARRAFGDYPAFVVGWMDWISSCAAPAAIAIVFGQSVAALLGLAARTATPIGMSVVIIFTLLLINGTALGDRAQRITSIAKTLAFGALILACFVAHPHATATVATATPAPTATGFAAFLLAAQAVIYAYDGWSAPIYFSEELDDPGRDIPRSSFLGLLSVVAIYVLINVAFVRVLPLSTLASSPLAAGTVASSLFGVNGERIVQLVIAIALPSAINACLLMASRVIFAMGRDGLALRRLTAVSKSGTPAAAIVASGVVTLAFLASGTFNDIIAIAAFFFVGSYTLSFTAVFLLRKREPTAERPYRALGHPYTTALVLVGSLGFLVSAVISDRRNSLIALAIVVVSYPVFRLTHGIRMVSVPSPDPYLSE